jgi:type IV secretory pathway TrbL component
MQTLINLFPTLCLLVLFIFLVSLAATFLFVALKRIAQFIVILFYTVKEG